MPAILEDSTFYRGYIGLQGFLCNYHYSDFLRLSAGAVLKPLQPLTPCLWGGHKESFWGQIMSGVRTPI